MGGALARGLLRRVKPPTGVWSCREPDSNRNLSLILVSHPRGAVQVQLRGIGWEKMQHDIGRNLELVAMMIAGTIHKQQDELSWIFLGQCGQKNLETFRIGRRHDQIDASSVLLADWAIELYVFVNGLGCNLR